MKKGFVLGLVTATIFSAGLTLASNMISDVYKSSFPIQVNGKEYKSEMPILNYQGRTYLPLREFGNSTGVNVDFRNNTILVDNFQSTNTKYFLFDSYMLLNYLSKIDKNIDSMFSSYIDFLKMSDPYASSNITNMVNTNTVHLNSLNEYSYLYYFETYGNFLGLKDISSLSNKISEYIKNATTFQSTITDAMYLKTSSTQVSNEWDKLIDDYTEISHELNMLILSIN